MNEYLQSFYLALLQGLTEFLPVSSSGHLVLLPRLAGWHDQGLDFDVAAHIGTLLAVLIYFHSDVRKILADWFGSLRGGPVTHHSRLAWSIVIATAITGIAALLFEEVINSVLRAPLPVAVATLVFGVLLGLADWLGPKRRSLEDVDHRGLHLIYSQFRTLEGIGILRLVLEANGFTQFKLIKDGTQWRLNISEEDKGKPMFALYTGTESREEKEIIRNVFNSTWRYIPTSLRDQIQAISSNNFYGEIIKVLMITASGAEGISLKNVRYVHITEPYWHPVRIQQVIGRARRICSHQDLPEKLRTVDVFLYLMKFSRAQLDSDEAIELRLKDKSKIDNITPVTSDQALYEIATMKEEVTEKILLAVKEASFDCSLHAREGDKEQLKCFSFGSVDSSKFSYVPSYSAEEADTVADRNKTVIELKAVEVTLDGVKYAFDQLTGDVYDLDSYKRGQPVKVGTLEVEGDPSKKGAKYIYRPI